MKKLLPFALILWALFGNAQNVEISTDSTAYVEEAFSVYPNPVVFTFLVEVDLKILAEKIVSFELFNIAGERVIFRERLTNPVELLERGHLPAGVYSYLFKSGPELLKKGKILFVEF